MSYPNDFTRSHFIAQLMQQHAQTDAARLEALQTPGAIAGRLVEKGADGDVSMGVIQDGSGRMAIVVSDEASGKAGHAAYREWKLGDIIGVHGILCRLEAGQLAIRAHDLRHLVGPRRPLPEDWLGPQRARAAKIRSRLLREMRSFLAGRLYMEVETPILVDAAVAATQQFKTRHNALDREFLLRDSGERRLESLLVGGIEQLFEVSRVFINGPSGEANEQTVLEIQCAYTNESYMMALLEAMLTRATRLGALGAEEAPPPLKPPFARRTVSEIIAKHAGGNSLHEATGHTKSLGEWLRSRLGQAADGAQGPGMLQRRLLEAVAPDEISGPTFVSGFAADACPSARSREDGATGEYFELFLGGWRVAEGRSVVNDPDQFLGAHGGGVDRDLLRALEYGMPPAGATRLFLDHLMLALVGGQSLRDTMLFRMSS